MPRIKMTAQEFQEKHATNLKHSIPFIQKGVMNVEESPTAKAATKKDKMLQNLTAAVNSGKWEAGLKAVSLEDWQKAMLEKGTGRIAQGIDGASAKVQRFGEKLIAYENNLLTTVDKMPDLTIDDSINKMVAWTRGMAKFQK